MKIKQIIAIIFIVILMMMTLSACGIYNDKTPEVLYNNRFKEISYCKIDSSTFIMVYYDTETLVMYQIARGDGGKSMSPLYNSDGTLMLYNPPQKE